LGVAASFLVSSCDEAETGPSPEVANGTCAPHGELFTDHYSCENMDGPDATSRSGEPATAKIVMPTPDRLDDPDQAWLREELSACSCICCHRAGGISAYVWAYDFEPVVMDSVSDDVLSRFTDRPPAHAAVIPPEANNGFSRVATGFPTTDRDRFLAFVNRERARRGLK